MSLVPLGGLDNTSVGGKHRMKEGKKEAREEVVPHHGQLCHSLYEHALHLAQLMSMLDLILKGNVMGTAMNGDSRAY